MLTIRKASCCERSARSVVVLPSHTDAERAVMELRRAGFDMSRLSIVGADFHTEEHVGALSAIGRKAALPRAFRLLTQGRELIHEMPR
jgi:hypothetical protein